MTSKETRQEIVAHAVRWATNMLVEVCGNHGGILTEAQRECLKTATSALSRFQSLPQDDDPGT